MTSGSTIPVTAEGGAEDHPALGVFGRMIASMLLSNWTLARLSNPDLRAMLARVAEDAGRFDKLRELIIGLHGITQSNVNPNSGGAFLAGDYVSPGFVRVSLDKHFPNMIVGNQSRNDWAYLRRGLPHNWYVDRRVPHIGFVNRDEAHILFNTALRACGRPALEIGCFYGWSSCHLALAGVQLDIVDPLLSDAAIRESVSASLISAGVSHRCRLYMEPSPGAVETIARLHGRRWNLIFIDGDHAAPSPRVDAEACARYAADDCIVLFHDLAAPAVADGLRYFKTAGWNIRVYNTSQIMGAAWRGGLSPAEHLPDPALGTEFPTHLADLV